MKRTAIKRSAPETIRAWQNRTRKPLPQRSKRTGGNEIPAASRRAVLKRSRGVCEARIVGCSYVADHMHHVLPRRYRDHSPEALLHVCHACHSDIHAHPTISYALGHLRRGVA